MAARQFRAFWLDIRFLIGVLLVAGSVAGVVAVVAAADETVEIYAARDTLLPGDRVSEAELVARPVRLAEADRTYLTVGDLPADGVVLTRPVAQGELLPRSVLGDAADVESASVMVSITGELAEAVAPGAAVDLWSSPSGGAGEDLGPPAVLVPEATVARIAEPEGMVVAGDAVSVELLVPDDRVARVLEAVAAEDALALVPVGGRLG